MQVGYGKADIALRGHLILRTGGKTPFITSRYGEGNVTLRFIDSAVECNDGIQSPLLRRAILHAERCMPEVFKPVCFVGVAPGASYLTS